MLVITTLLTTSISGCTNPMGEQKPSVTVTTHYTEPTPTPAPCPTPVPANTTWNGMIVKLHGNISAEPGEHIYGTVTVNYLEKDYWDDHPTASYDTANGGTYSLDVRAKVPFKLDIGYLYMGQIPQGYMLTKRIDQVYTIDEDTPLDLEVMTSNITPKN